MIESKNDRFNLAVKLMRQIELIHLLFLLTLRLLRTGNPFLFLSPNYKIFQNWSQYSRSSTKWSYQKMLLGNIGTSLYFLQLYIFKFTRNALKEWLKSWLYSCEYINMVLKNSIHYWTEEFWKKLYNGDVRILT